MLLKPQEPHHDRLVAALKTYGCAIDSSETGTGKTYAAAAVAKTLGLKPLVICPLSVQISWKRTFELFDLPYLGIANYELIAGSGSWHPPTVGSGLGPKKKCPGLTVKRATAAGPGSYEWDETIFDADTLLIFDEVHLCKNPLTRNSKLLLAAKDLPCKKLLLSATIADKPHYFAVFATMLGLVDNVDEFRLYLKKLRYGGVGPTTGPYASKPVDPSQYGKAPDKALVPMMALHYAIFPSRGSRMRKLDFGADFPSNDIKADIYTMDEDTTAEIQKQYDYISMVSREAEALEAVAPCKLVEILRARQKIESLKVKTMAELAVEAMENDGSPVLFVNYSDTMALLVDQLKKEYGIEVKCKVHGGQSPAERTRIIDDFQSDRENIIICQIRSGGVGISLHDMHGRRPRIAIISPSWSAQDLVQAFGRIHRAKGQTPCIQKLVYCSDTIEEHVCNIVNTKLINYVHFNDGNVDTSASMISGMNCNDNSSS